ncbi:MAG: TIGR03936 family radical SAM-associated protein [Mobilitalea sp.]
MKARIKFQKYGAMKFIGHLDVMRYFQKAFRRANYDSEYTKGFSPHQIMSFAAPLGVGLTSDAEYLDIQLLSSDEPQVMVDRLNAVLTEGVRILDFHPLLEPEANTRTVTAMSLVASADYVVSFKDGYEPDGVFTTQEDFKKAFLKFYEKSEIVIGKKTKKSETEVDIKPMINFVAFDEKEYVAKLQDFVKEPVKVSLTETVAQQYENGIKIYMQIDTGSSANLKPELVMEAFYEEYNLSYTKFSWQVHRLEVYTKDSESGKLAALNQVER